MVHVEGSARRSHRTARNSEGTLGGRMITKEDANQEKALLQKKARTYTRVTDQAMSDTPGQKPVQ